MAMNGEKKVVSTYLSHRIFKRLAKALIRLPVCHIVGNFMSRSKLNLMQVCLALYVDR